MGRIATESEWEKRIEGFKKSGQTQNKWCKENGINQNTLKNHLYKRKHPHPIQTASNTTKWIELQHNPSSNLEIEPEGLASLKIQIGVATIEVTKESNLELLKNVAQVLKNIC